MRLLASVMLERPGLMHVPEPMCAAVVPKLAVMSQQVSVLETIMASLNY